MDMEAEIRAAWCLNVFKLLEVLGTELLFHRSIRWVKIKISSKSVGPVVLTSSSIGECKGSNNLNKHSASRFHLFIMFIVSAVSQVPVAIHRPRLGQVFGLVHDLHISSIKHNMSTGDIQVLPSLVF